MGETEQFTRKARGEKRDRDREINKYQGNSFFSILHKQKHTIISKRKNKRRYIQESFK